MERRVIEAAPEGKAMQLRLLAVADDGAGACLGHRDNEGAKVVAGRLVVLHVSAVAQGKGFTEPAAAVHLLFARIDLVLHITHP